MKLVVTPTLFDEALQAAVGPSSGTCGGDCRALRPLHRGSGADWICEGIEAQWASDGDRLQAVWEEGSGRRSGAQPSRACRPAIFTAEHQGNVARPSLRFGGGQPGIMGRPMNWSK